MDTQITEQKIAEYLRSGGKITRLPAIMPSYISHRTKWHMGGINNNRKQYLRKSTVAATPGGRREPGRPYKPWQTLIKKSVKPTIAGRSAADQFNAAAARITGI